MIALRVMTSLTCTFSVIAIQADLHHRGAVFLDMKSNEDVALVLLFAAAMGKFITGHFELNGIDKLHTKFHYIGVMTMSVGTLCVGFVLHWSFLSIVLLSLYFGLFIGWQIFCSKCVKKSDDIRIVTWNSKMCIGIE